ncbi:hypothetical protein FB451DRAFT_1370920 [Mycena latifolia]|nr:hypothetical protein FB451DRAFT_1370920 [Mycena latifolia]
MVKQQGYGGRERIHRESTSKQRERDDQGGRRKKEREEGKIAQWVINQIHQKHAIPRAPAEFQPTSRVNSAQWLCAADCTNIQVALHSGCLLVRSIKVPAVAQSLTTWATTLNDTAVPITLADTENSGLQIFNIVAICK